jgi:hypothetical protein
MRIEQRISVLEQAHGPQQMRTIWINDLVWSADEPALKDALCEAAVKRFRGDTGFNGKCFVILGTMPGVRPADTPAIATGTYEDLSTAKTAKSVFAKPDAALMATAAGLCKNDAATVESGRPTRSLRASYHANMPKRV